MATSDVVEVVGQVWPVYFVADESNSMSPVMVDLNAGLTATYASLLAEPMAAAKVRFSVVGFSDTATTRMALRDLREPITMPQLSARSTTDYCAAFQHLYERLPTDVNRLKSDGYQVHRPGVFFLTDGQPTNSDGYLIDDDSWLESHHRLTDRTLFQYAPNVMAFGIGTAKAETLLKIATREDFAFVAIAGVDVGMAISEFVDALTVSMVKSAQSLAAGRGEIVIEKPSSFTLAVDLV